MPEIYPDYSNVTVPCNIAPLNFMLSDESYDECIARITTPDGVSQTYGEGRKVIIPEDEWQDILSSSAGRDVMVEVWGRKNEEWYSFRKFSISVATDSIDGYISYRLIEPSYVLYNYMEIAQRELGSFKESTIFNNKVACNDQKGQCINCHSYKNYRTDNMLFHVRVTNGGTMLVNDGRISKVDLKRDYTISAGVYPSWHPTENLIAFSTNTTRQDFHTANRNKTEVFDYASDLILYDPAKDDVSVISADTTRLEVFPTWSPDGRYLYYCSTVGDIASADSQGDSVASAMASRDIRYTYKNVRYNLYRRSFNVKTRQFGREELVYDAASKQRSVSLPRVSPDGRSVIFAEGSYGCFNIWHHDADIVMIDVPASEVSAGQASSAGVAPRTGSLSLLNSREFADSYPSWSSNGRWIMCASRRDDGNYSRVYISYFDGRKAHKAFLLPQKDPEYNTLLLKSYNRPEFMVEPVKHSIDDFRGVVEK